MISVSRAQDRIQFLSEDALRKLTAQRVLGTDLTPVESAYADEPSEDLVIALLQVKALPNSKRGAVIRGLKDVHFELYAWLASSEPRDGAFDVENIAVRYCRTLDIAAPSELFPLVSSLLRLVLDSPDISATVQKAVVRAALGYPQRERHAELWTDALEISELASYAFTALLRIDPKASRIDKALIELWRRRYSDDWPVNAVGLLRRAERARGSDQLVPRVMSTLKREASESTHAAERWTRIAQELGQSSSTASWLNTASIPHKLARVIDSQEIGASTFARYAKDREIVYHQQTVGRESASIHFDFNMNVADFEFMTEINETVMVLAEKCKVSPTVRNQAVRDIEACLSENETLDPTN